MRRPASGLGVAPAFLAVTYDGAGTRSTASVVSTEQRAGATLVRELHFGNLNTTVRVVSVAPGQASSATALLRAQSGVRRVDPTGLPAYAFTVSGPTYTNDPYFQGFATTVTPARSSTPPPATYHMQPYVESANVPGQWDMHAIRLAYAFSYAAMSNGSSIINSGALGSAGVKIAIIDTGVDANHPELQSKVVYQHCFITNPTTGVGGGGPYAGDPQGHGTNVAGIAAAASNNGLGFTGAGGASTIYAYRVFPTPRDACATPESTDKQCQTSTLDITSAINDAVDHNVNVISLSLGGGSCANGQDPDPTEGAAIANAIKANIVVVAASGNNGQAPAAPACDPGVIAVGATALADASPNGSSYAGGSPTMPMEYVPTYSAFGTPGSAPNDVNAWGIVAPGGDPKPDPNPNDTTGATADLDDLHWIENIWTTTPFDSNFAGGCTADYTNPSGKPDCRTLIAGTSMSTPHVAGAAALLIAANPMYQSPALMKQLLCRSADNIGDVHQGCGRLNVERAMAIAVGDSQLP